MNRTKTTQHKEGKATVRIVYRTAKTLSDGSHPFWVRITKNRKTSFVATGLSLLPKFWNINYTGYREAIRKSYPEPYRDDLIKKLNEWERKYVEAAEALATADEQHNVQTVVNKAVEGRKQTRSATLLTYTDELVAAMASARQKGNSNIYRDLRNQLSDFIIHNFAGQKTDVTFSEVTVRFCNQLEIFFRERGNVDTTLSNRYRTLRAIFNKAIAEGIAKPEHYPFARNTTERHKFSIAKFDTSTQKRSISRDDIRKIEAYIPVGTYDASQFPGIRNAKALAKQKNDIEVARLMMAKNVFLFSFYTGGINFVDLAKLRWPNLTVDDKGDTRLFYVRQKTGGRFSLKLLPIALGIIEQYKTETYNGPDSYLFPILNAGIHQTETQVGNRLNKVLGQVNRSLKLLGTRLSINIPLTTYVARHAMAVALRRAGTATAVISQAMGHKSEAVTAIYLDSFSSDTVDDAFNSLL